MSGDMPASNWRFCRSEGYVEALREHYPYLLKMSPFLQACVNQIEMAEAAIDKFMADLADGEEE